MADLVEMGRQWGDVSGVKVVLFGFWPSGAGIAESWGESPGVVLGGSLGFPPSLFPCWRQILVENLVRVLYGLRGWV